MESRSIDLSINPSYLCNLRCSFCYLGEKNLRDKEKISLGLLKSRLDEICISRKLGHVDVYGGEITVLPEAYVEAIIALIKTYRPDSISLVTNLTRLPKYLQDPEIGINVSYDFSARNKNIEVLRNMMWLNRSFSIITLVSPVFVSKELDPDRVIRTLKALSYLHSFELKPYSQSKTSQGTVSSDVYEKLVLTYLLKIKDSSFIFKNKYLLDEILQSNNSYPIEDHLFINPQGKFCILVQEAGKEFFQPYESFNRFLEEKNKRTDEALKNSFCKSCKYFGKCLTEHPVLNDVCSGYRGLIDQYRQLL